MISVIQINFKDCLINKMKCCKCIYFIQDFVLTRDQYVHKCIAQFILTFILILTFIYLQIVHSIPEFEML